MFNQPLREEARFIAAFKLGEADFNRDDTLTHEEVRARIARLRAV